VFVENRPGAMTMIANQAASNAPPDGYTLFLGASEMTMLPYMKKSAASFDPLRDLTPVALVANTWGAFLVGPKFEPKTLPELVSYAKANPDRVRYGTNGVGGVQHLAVELLQMAAGIKLHHVPYKGTAQVATDTLSGEIEMSSMALSSAVANRERLRIVAQTGPTRHPSLAEVPTTAELGLPQVRVDIWFGVMTPPKTPPPIVDRVSRAVDAVLRQPAVREKLVSMGCEVDYMPPAAFSDYIGAEKKKWAQLIPMWGISIDD
jgi:tripartite-type tricarboxylate transporter receptor subunit TctC